MSVAAENFDPLALFTTLNKHRVNYVVIGGIAATIRGSDSITGDVDICYQRTKENVRRLAPALKELHAKLADVAEGVPLQIDEQSIRSGDTFAFETDYGHFDCLANPSGTTGFDDIRAAATSEEIGGTHAVVCSLDDLIRMKEAAGRVKDRVALEQLYSLKRLIERS